MRNKGVHVVMAAMACVLALGLGGCSGSTGADSKVSAKPTASSSGSTSDRKASKVPSAETPRASASSSASGTHVVADSYQFDIPSYWRGRVRVSVSGDDVVVYSAAYPSFAVCRFKVGNAQNLTGGDIGNARMGAIKLSGDRNVQMWATRWAFVAADAALQGTAGGTIPTDAHAQELTDLQTGGSITYKAIRVQFVGSKAQNTSLLSNIDSYMSRAVLPSLKAR